MKFKKGDKVICVDNKSSRLKRGKIYTIGNNFVTVDGREDRRQEELYFSSRFKKVGITNPNNPNIILKD